MNKGVKPMQKDRAVKVFPAGVDYFKQCVEMAQKGWCLLSTVSRGGWTTATFVYVPT